MSYDSGRLDHVVLRGFSPGLEDTATTNDQVRNTDGGTQRSSNTASQAVTIISYCDDLLLQTVELDYIEEQQDVPVQQNTASPEDSPMAEVISRIITFTYIAFLLRPPNFCLQPADRPL